MVPSAELTLLLGVHNKTLPAESEPNRRKVAVSKILIHEDYNLNTHENDIALLKLGEAPAAVHN